VRSVTATPKNPRVTELRELFRQLLAIRSTYQETGLEEVVSPAGNVWSIWDLEYLLKATQRLSQRQQQAITLCLVHGMREKQAAVSMGVSETNPVMMYATLGLQRLLDMVDEGSLGRFVVSPPTPEQLAIRHSQTVASLAEHIESRVVKMRNGCWLYPTTCSGDSLLLVRSPQSPTGYAGVSPLKIMYEARKGPVPRGCLLRHTTRITAASLDCANPEHGEPVVTPARKAEIQAMAARYRRSQQGAGVRG
jgi:hypothetical protein